MLRTYKQQDFALGSEFISEIRPNGPELRRYIPSISLLLLPAWTETLEKFKELVLGQFRVAINSSCLYAGATEDRFELGLASIQDKYLPEVRTCRKPSATCVAVVS
jgi:hypothetical protein